MMYDINLNSYNTGIILGVPNDGKGTAHLALHKKTNTHVVIKKYGIDDKEGDDYSLIEQEIITTRKLQHPNVLPYLNAFISGQDIYVITPLMGYGSCSALLQEHFLQGFPELAIAFIIKDVLHGLDYIHKKGYIHRALRASHILISANGQACICGLRYSCETIKDGKRQRTIYSFPKSSTNNLKWLSPELLQQDLHGYNEKSDIYSLGMTICELANGVVPFSNVPETLMLTEKVRGCIPQIIDRSTYLIDTEQTAGIVEDGSAINDEKNLSAAEVVNNDNPVNNKKTYCQTMATRKFSEPFHDITELCLQYSPSTRPGINQLLSHLFFKQCKKSNTTLLGSLVPIRPLNEHYVEIMGEQTLNLANELENLELESCHWDFENT